MKTRCSTCNDVEASSPRSLCLTLLSSHRGLRTCFQPSRWWRRDQEFPTSIERPMLYQFWLLRHLSFPKTFGPKEVYTLIWNERFFWWKSSWKNENSDDACAQSPLSEFLTVTKRFVETCRAWHQSFFFYKPARLPESVGPLFSSEHARPGFVLRATKNQSEEGYLFRDDVKRSLSFRRLEWSA